MRCYMDCNTLCGMSSKTDKTREHILLGGGRRELKIDGSHCPFINQQEYKSFSITDNRKR